MKKLVSHIKQLSFYDTLRHGSVYMFSFVVIQLLMVLTLPIFTKLLTPSDFGIYEVFNNTVRIFGVILSLNLFNGFYRYYFDEHIDKKALVQFLLRTSFLAFIVGSGIIYLLQTPLLKLLNLPQPLLIWIPIGVFSNIVFSFFYAYNNAQRLSTRGGVWQFFYQFSRVIGGVLVVLYVVRNYYGRITGENGILLLMSLLVIVIYFRKYLGFSEHLPQKKEIVKYSVSFIPIGLSGFALGYLDTIMINNYKGHNDAGLYSYAYKIAVIYTGITTAFVTANRPKLFELMNEKKEEEVIAQLRSMFKLVVALSALFIFFSADGGRLLALNKSFHAGLYLMPVLILSYIFNDLNELYCFYFFYEKKVKYFYFSFAVAAIINFVLNLILIPIYGYPVAAYTTLVSYGFMLVCTYIICKKFLSVRVPAVIRFIDYILIIILVLIANYFITGYIENWWLQIGVKLIVYGLVILYLWRNIIIRYFEKEL
ncbi:MAG: polysaccharide biosynthesis protein [Bacteroidota bacterium]|nr:polysaccharide biosynthesis protein [Bacteroidota bacterium]